MLFLREANGIEMKDNFSGHAQDYAAYRPTYPQALFDWLETIVPEQPVVWDCATGNGQLASGMAGFAKKICATDMSVRQIESAVQAENIFYSVCPAEESGLPDKTFDLITVAQAVHWFDFGRFYEEVRRVAKPGAKLVLVGYGKVITGSDTDPLIDELYGKTLGPFWDPERRYLDDRYETIPFPFGELSAPDLAIEVSRTAEEFANYLETWSAVKHFEKKRRFSPLDEIRSALSNVWHGRRVIHFPLYIRAGYINEAP
jgi:SAM-dependent methyltransferase